MTKQSQEMWSHVNKCADSCRRCRSILNLGHETWSEIHSLTLSNLRTVNTSIVEVPKDEFRNLDKRLGRPANLKSTGNTFWLDIRTILIDDALNSSHQWCARIFWEYIFLQYRHFNDQKAFWVRGSRR